MSTNRHDTLASIIEAAIHRWVTQTLNVLEEDEPHDPQTLAEVRGYLSHPQYVASFAASRFLTEEGSR